MLDPAAQACSRIDSRKLHKMKYLSIFMMIAIASSTPAAKMPTGAVSVKGFGAKGDGVTDDTAAIQSGFDAACGQRYTIAMTTGAGVSPIVITTTAPHTFLNGSTLTIEGVKGNTNANGRWSATV